MALTAEMTEEEHRHVKEGLENEEQLAVYDTLLKPDITKQDIQKMKKVAAELLQKLEGQVRDVHDLFSKHTTREQFKAAIYDFLYDDRTGLPEEFYDESDLKISLALCLAILRIECETEISNVEYKGL